MNRLSQHLTVRRKVLERLVELADPTPSDVVIEPGCGDGRLTELLAERGCKVLAVEIDPRLAAKASYKLQDKANVKIILGDILKTSLKGSTMVVGNPPYHISRRLIEWITTNPYPRRVVVTLQKEFAHKLASQPGHENHLYISLVSQMFYNIEIHDQIPPNAFNPKPRVASLIVRMQRNQQKPLEPHQLRLLKNIFTDRRHVLGKVLRKMGYRAPEELANKRIYHLTPRDALAILEFLSPTRD